MNYKQLHLGVPLEVTAGETRVAATPETVKKFAAQGWRVTVQNGAGLAAGCTDDAYAVAGAQLGSAAATLGADVVLKVRRPSAGEVAQMQTGAVLVGARTAGSWCG